MGKTTKTVTVTIALDRHEKLKDEATRNGLPLPTFCRSLLSKAADQFSEKPA